MEKTPRILVVDDEASWINNIVAAFADTEHEIVTASSYMEAGILLDESAFDLVISDNHMKVSNAGLELRERMWLKSQEHIPFILYTYDDSPHITESLKKHGNAWHRTKSTVPPARLARFAMSVLRKRGRELPHEDSS
ncbi:MAG: response regulator [Patescibacteria group bacterium]